MIKTHHCYYWCVLTKQYSSICFNACNLHWKLSSKTLPSRVYSGKVTIRYCTLYRRFRQLNAPYIHYERTSYNEYSVKFADLDSVVIGSTDVNKINKKKEEQQNRWLPLCYLNLASGRCFKFFSMKILCARA